MTNFNSGDRNRWTDERLDQLAATAAANTEAITELRAQQEALVARYPPPNPKVAVAYVSCL